MGVFEDRRFEAGTRALAEAVASCPGFTVVGGGETAAALHEFGLEDRIDHISSGGGATLELLEKGDLPGLAALRSSASAPAPLGSSLARCLLSPSPPRCYRALGSHGRTLVSTVLELEHPPRRLQHRVGIEAHGVDAELDEVFGHVRIVRGRLPAQPRVDLIAATTLRRPAGSSP